MCVDSAQFVTSGKHYTTQWHPFPTSIIPLPWLPLCGKGVERREDTLSNVIRGDSHNNFGDPFVS